MIGRKQSDDAQLPESGSSLGITVQKLRHQILAEAIMACSFFPA